MLAQCHLHADKAFVCCSGEQTLGKYPMRSCCSFAAQAVRAGGREGVMGGIWSTQGMRPMWPTIITITLATIKHHDTQ